MWPRVSEFRSLQDLPKHPLIEPFMGLNMALWGILEGSWGSRLRKFGVEGCGFKVYRVWVFV